MNVQSLERSRIRYFAAPVVVALVLRAALLAVAVHFTGLRVLMEGDTSGYLRPGFELFLHGRFFSSGIPEIDRTPGYPIFAMLSGAFYSHFLLVCIAQIVIAMISVALVARIASRIFSCDQAGIAAACCFACDPLSIEYSIRLMSETLFVFLILLFLDRMIIYLDTPHRKQPLLVAAILLAAATYVRPVSYWMAFLLPVFVAARSTFGADKTFANKNLANCRDAALFLLISALLLVPWQIRNFEQSSYAGFSSIVEKNLYFYEAAAVTAKIEHRTLTEEQASLGKEDDSYLRFHAEQIAWTPVMRLRFMRAESLRIIAAHPIVFLETYLHGVCVVVFAPSATEFLRMIGFQQVQQLSLAEYWKNTTSINHLPVSGILVFSVFLLVLVAFELFLLTLYVALSRTIASAQKEDSAVHLIALVSLYFLLISGGGQAVSRLRSPAMAGITILAGGGIAMFVMAWKKNQTKANEAKKW